MPTDWYRRHKRDPHYRAAKKQGYRSRSAFKLKQIQNRFSLMRPGDAVVDLGATPGGWSQVASEIVGNGMVVAVDREPLRPVDGVLYVQGDMTRPETLERVVGLVEGRIPGGQVRVVLSDMSPQISGNRDVDVANSEWLCRQALAVAERVLAPGGSLVVKIFEGSGFPEFRDELRPLFGTVKPFSPPASDKRSREVYLVCQGWKGAAPGAPGQ